jgi:predicted aspartyl protease
VSYPACARGEGVQVSTIRYGYYRQVQPPAPFVNVILQHPFSGAELRDVPSQVDCGADRTVLPEKLAQALGLPQVGTVQIAGLGGTIQHLPSFAVLLGVHNLPLQRIEVVTSVGEPWILLGRDVLNSHRILLDGPRLSLEIG